MQLAPSSLCYARRGSRPNSNSRGAGRLAGPIYFINIGRDYTYFFFPLTLLFDKHDFWEAGNTQGLIPKHAQHSSVNNNFE
jgi:hypothetical protein